MTLTLNRPVPVARIIATVLLAAALVLMKFAYWGLCTPAGKRAYDEMDAIWPFAVGVLGAVLAIGAAVLWWLGGRRRTHKL